jgi:hypothetical protein
MADQWHYSHAEQEFGPFSAVRMKDLAATGEVLPTDAVWKEGGEGRVVAAKVKGLFRRTPLTKVALSISGAMVREPVPPAAIVARSTPADVSALANLLQSVTATGSSSEPAVVSARPADVKSRSQAMTGHDQRRTSPEPIQKLRVVAIRGAIIVSQDGRVACYKKKCINCGHEDPNRATMQIRRGINRISFFCPDCRKLRIAEIQGVR